MDNDEFNYKWSLDGYIDEEKIKNEGRWSKYMADKAELQKSIQLAKEKEIETYDGMSKKDFDDYYRNNMYPDGGEEDDQHDK